MPTDLFTAFQDFDDSVSQHVKQYSGLLGLPVASKTVEVPNRNGYVYVRLRDNTSEIVQAYNEKVSPVYNLPVLIERQGNRWVVVNRDIERYENWGSYSAFLPAHAHQHEFDRDNPGGDTVFSYIDQLMPLNVYPSGTPGSPNVVMGGYSFKKNDGNWAYVGNTGTNSLLIYRPTDNQARMVLVYLDKATGNPGILVNSGTSFAASITGTHDVLQYLPANASTLEPAKAVRLVSGTTYIGWDNLYDVRQFFGGGIEEAPIDGLLYGRKNAGWAQVTGTGGAGTPAGSDTYVQYNQSSAFGASNRFIFDYNNGVLIVGDGTSVPVAGTNEFHIIAEDSSPSIGLWAASNSSSINPFIKAVRYRGSFASPLALDQFDEILQIRAAGYNGTNLTATQAEILVDVPYTWASGSHPTEMGFWVTASGTATLQNIVKVREDGLNLASGKLYLINNKPIADSHGWQLSKELWTRVSNFTFTTTAELQRGDKIRYKDGGTFEYGVVAYVSGSAPSTIGLITNSDYAMAAANITERYFSRVENPYGFPTVFTFTPVTTNLTIGDGTLTGYWDAHGDMVKGRVNVIFGSTTSLSSSLQIDYPSPHKAFVGKRESLGVTIFWDNSASALLQQYLGNTVHNSTLDKMVPQVVSESGAYPNIRGIDATIPFTWAVDDEISSFFEYPMG